ncbi:MAG: alpha/beta fold hydrolase [Acidimicrobiia bacterium]|nr:alpha/beta fold hydrolase [Acidimicrobiia bacterium]
MSAALQQWHGRGARLEVPGTAGTRIWREGDGPAVVCLHGVPASAYLYRKVLPELAARGLEGIALDLQGLGFSDRPEHFDYSWTGLSGWLEKALDAAGIGDLHLVVHDIGGPVGFDLIRRNPARIRSLTVLNTITKVASFTKPLVMRPFEYRGAGEAMVRSMNSPMVGPFMRWKGTNNTPTFAELRVYGELLTHGDGGKAFLQVMRNFEANAQFESRILPVLAEREFPAQIVWSRGDPELTAEPFGAMAKEALGLETDIHLVEGKHFLQEDSFAEIAERVALLVDAGTDI